MIIYHHPGCSKSRCALAYLQEQKHTFEIRYYLTEPFTKLELVALLSKLNLLPLAIVRKEELVYKTLIKDKFLSDDAFIDILLKNPKLIQRPIVEFEANAVVARPLENLIVELDK